MALEDIVSSLLGSNIYNTAPPTGSIMYDYFLPFVIIWVVFYGILSALNIFRHKSNNINLILSVGLTLMMTATPYWFAVGQFISEWGAWTSVILFVVVFTFGIVMWAFGRGHDYYTEAGSPGSGYVGGKLNRRKLDKLIEERERIRQKWSLLPEDSSQRKAEWAKLEIIEKEIKQMKEKLEIHD